MKCEPAQHTYRPFPRSRALFCSSCGDQVDGGGGRNATPDMRPAASARQQSLPLGIAASGGDPDGDRAREIIEEQRAQHREARHEFEETVRRMISESNAPPEMAEQLLRDVIEFGPGFDLDHLAALLEQFPAPEDGGGIGDLIPE